MEKLQELINQVGMNRLLALGGVAAAAMIGWRMWASSQSTGGGNTTSARCTCGWVGMASKLRPVCPKCGSRPKLM